MVLEVKDKLAELIKPPADLVTACVNWGLLEESLFDHNIVDLYNLACMAATVLVETGGLFQPIKEYGSDNYFITNYWDNVQVRNELGNLTAADAVNYCGKGFIQLSGRNNVTKFAQSMNDMSILANPNRLLEPRLSAKSAAWFWVTHGLSTICLQLKTVAPQYHRSILIEVRRRVNGGINGLSQFLQALKILQIE